ncbi:MAG: hypothetical protein A3D31_06630 [Candidatus Fluviicola riflensis]|nr:MAG: hypothetical protein CHH17_08380 [Candidatus Fluviicola riflensis]OGS79634.1 MAG: hypothetical protein A3D31_06630 [Candidatus Fluviicola riflensis]OGS87065.1 MAG: hypothetical protein A2724_06090 [Fluviicola sp. RIFCSPHIGHO2_01_FULL_43_53]OGS89857.1 MAG: hypothetical protein A3E30_02840 [Fluviicola sp. RIFCSPHIGHO2_12_FULL_43_24]
MAVKTGNRGEMSPESGFKKLFLDELKDIYWAEKALTKALPKMVKQASSTELIEALEDHLAVTETHIDRLEQVFDIIGEKASGKKCEAMEGLIAEAETIMEETEEGVVRDAGIISAAQKVEHYEIASYGTLVAFANALSESAAADLLEDTLNEEKEADQTLTEIAMSSINIDAANETSEE